MLGVSARYRRVPGKKIDGQDENSGLLQSKIGFFFYNTLLYLKSANTLSTEGTA